MVPLGSRNLVAEADDTPATEIEIPLKFFATKEQLIELTKKTNGGEGLLASNTVEDNVELLFDLNVTAPWISSDEVIPFRLLGASDSLIEFVSAQLVQPPVDDDRWNVVGLEVPWHLSSLFVEPWTYTGAHRSALGSVWPPLTDGGSLRYVLADSYMLGSSWEYSVVHGSISDGGGGMDWKYLSPGEPCVYFSSLNSLPLGFSSSFSVVDGEVVCSDIGSKLRFVSSWDGGPDYSLSGASVNVSDDGRSLHVDAPADSSLLIVAASEDGGVLAGAVHFAAVTSDFVSVADVLPLDSGAFRVFAWLESCTDYGAVFATEPVEISYGSLSGAAGGSNNATDGSVDQSADSDSTAKPEVDLPTGSETPDTAATSKLSTTVDGLNIFVEDPTKALPDGVYLDVQLIEPGSDHWNELSANYDGTHEVENVSFFEITLRYIKDASPVEMPLSSPIRVLMQIPDGWDKTDMEAVLIASGADRQFEENIVTKDGIDYVAFWSDHFSPYALIDKLSDAENANSKFVPTGDQVTYLTISGLGLIMTLALGLMLKTYFGGRKFND